MKLYELVDKYHRETDLTCAEAMLKACNEYFKLNISKESMSLLSLMGIGMQTELSSCGAFTIAVALIGYFSNPDNVLNVDNELGEEMVFQLTDKVLEEFGNLQCRALNQLEIQDYENPCNFIVVKIAQYLEDILNEYIFKSSEIR